MVKSVSAEIYDSNYYLEKMAGKDHFSKGKIEERFYKALNLAKIKKGMVVLDIGTGRGEIAMLCAGRKAKVWAIDYSLEAIKIAKNFSEALLNQSERNNINFRVMNAGTLRFKDNYFDRIFFLETLEHLYPEEAEKVLLEIKRVLKPEGKLVLSTGPNVLLVKPLLFLGSLVTGIKLWESRKYHVNEQNYFGLRKLLLDSGFYPSIIIGHDRNWLYGQICDQDMNKFIKVGVKKLNELFDSIFFYNLRRLPLMNILFGTNFLCLCSKNGK